MKDLLRKYLEGRATPEEKRAVDDWYESLSEGREEKTLSDTERSYWRNLYWNSIRRHTRTSAVKSRDMWPVLAAVAACIAFAVVIILYDGSPDQPDDRLSAVTAMTEVIANDSQEKMRLTLPDSSQVTLFPASRLAYSKDFNVDKRTVTLSGEAFFDISHDAYRPFYVFANEVVTRVLGTSFKITAYPVDEQITVAVKSGKVSVYTQPADQQPLIEEEEEQIILTPNQQAVYTKNDGKVARMLVKEPQIVISEDEVRKIRFEGAPVSEIFEALEKMYNVHIDFEKELFSGCSITTSVSGDDLYERIDVICEIIGATYQVQDTTVRITGPGCN